MRASPALPVVIVLFAASIFGQTTADTAQATVVRATSAFSAIPVANIHLDGAAHGFAGSTSESGTFTLDLSSDGTRTLNLELNTLARTDITSGFDSTPVCSWTGRDGVSHQQSEHNCLLSVRWEVPWMGLQQRLTKLAVRSAKATVSSAISVQIGQPAISTKKQALFYSSLTTATLSLDSSTLLPESLDFSLHPDDNARIDIPITIHYSDYRQINGVEIPFHIEKFINNGLALDLRVENAEVK